MALRIIKFTWLDVAAVTQMVVPPLQSLGHKGSAGRIGVIGGSQDYCGAPFYSAVSSLKFGGDLAWVYCSQSAATPIKSYSPELMVTPVYNDASVLNLNPTDTQYESETTKAANVVSESFPRLHALVVGPGMGRNTNVMNITAEIIRRAREKDLPLVIDADGLWLVTQDLQIIMGYAKCILTPNQAEFERLITATVDYLTKSTSLSPYLDPHFVQCLLAELNTPEGTSTSTETASASAPAGETGHSTVCAADLAPHVRDARRVHALSAALGGVTVMRKGGVDIIASSLGNALRQGRAPSPTRCDSPTAAANTAVNSDSGSAEPVDRVYVLAGGGSPRRCGGLGDILSGATAVSLHWALQRKELLARLTDIAGPTLQTFSTYYPYSTTSTDAPQCAASSAHSDDTASQARNAALHACIFASVVSRKASEVAFAVKGRSMTAPDVIESLGAAFRIIHPEG